MILPASGARGLAGGQDLPARMTTIGGGRRFCLSDERPRRERNANHRTID